ncbi:hypothetical protein OFM39_31570, partial [Escherichia coli]|nr:hypothetical protein [Escherichia coli]
PYTEICNIKDSNKPTAIAEHDDKANAKRVAAFVRKVIHNEIPEVKAGGPLSLLVGIYFIKIYFWETYN